MAVRITRASGRYISGQHRVAANSARTLEPEASAMLRDQLIAEMKDLNRTTFKDYRQIGRAMGIILKGREC